MHYITKSVIEYMETTYTKEGDRLLKDRLSNHYDLLKRETIPNLYFTIDVVFRLGEIGYNMPQHIHNAILILSPTDKVTRFYLKQYINRL